MRCQTEPDNWAFPCAEGENSDKEVGMTIREYFAAHIAAGLAARDGVPFGDIADSAVLIADKLIQELNE